MGKIVKASLALLVAVSISVISANVLDTAQPPATPKVQAFINIHG
ncbi:hypothetical protein [Listeria booriae]|nr:hypothetical protein [Listeria booriae]MDT0112442.1 hypothetical protein [Listeria booriae]